MSDYTPITGELRGLLADMNWTEIIDHMQMSSGAIVDGDWLDHWHEQAEHVCDAIDSVHANLELENASLKAELDRVLGEDERDGWIELPKDADGVPIRVGDIVEYVDDTLAPQTVTSINLARDGWWVYTNGFGRRPDKCRRVTPDTWERIIEEVLQRGHDDYPLNVDTEPYVARCKALACDAE